MSYTVEKLDDFGRGIINVDNKICFVKNALCCGRTGRG